MKNGPYTLRIAPLDYPGKKYHAQLRSDAAKIHYECTYCGEKKVLNGNVYRIRLKKSKYGKLFCSGSCAMSYHKNQKLVACSTIGGAKSC